jgi:hypothetical protein
MLMYNRLETGFIQKPFTGEALAQKLRSLLDEPEKTTN